MCILVDKNHKKYDTKIPKKVKNSVTIFFPEACDL